MRPKAFALPGVPSDRRFFADHPARRFRLRRVDPVERRAVGHDYHRLAVLVTPLAGGRLGRWLIRPHGTVAELMMVFGQIEAADQGAADRLLVEVLAQAALEMAA